MSATMYLLAVNGIGWFTAVFLGLNIWKHLQSHHDITVSFLDIGHGDAILIQQGDNQVLIDGGRSGKVLREQLGKAVPFWNSSLEILVATHPDEDHIGGLLECINTYDVGLMFDTKMRSDSGTYRALQSIKQNMVNVKEVRNLEAIVGTIIRFPEGGNLEVLYPFDSQVHNTSKDTNATSIVMKLTASNGEIFLFTGDLSSKEENFLDTIPVTVLKVGHHGSKYSTSDTFLKRMHPRDAVISAGVNNRYHHPAPEVLARLQSASVRIFRTDEQGTITYHCAQDTQQSCVVSTEKD